LEFLYNILRQIRQDEAKRYQGPGRRDLRGRLLHQVGRRPTLVCGTAGCGKTVMAMEFLVRGATEFDEPGVFMSFEETDEDLTKNVASMGFDSSALCAHKTLSLDHVKIDRNEMEETGEYDLSHPSLLALTSHSLASLIDGREQTFHLSQQFVGERQFG
jgi:hypothetical protein